VDRVTVFGNFNFWDRDGLVMKRNAAGDYSLRVPFEPGQYEYLFSVDGREILDPANPDSVPNGLGGYNSALRVLPEFPGERPFITPDDYETGRRLVLRYRILPNDHEGGFSQYDIVAFADNRRLPVKYIRTRGERLELRIPRHIAENSRRIRVAWSGGKTVSNFSELILEKGLPAGNGENFRWQDAIIYSLMPDRFYDGDPSNNDLILHAQLAPRANFRGGDLQGVIRKIDEGYFNDLGVNTLWILPFIKNTPKAQRETPPPHRMYSGYHGYWPVAAREVDPHFGDLGTAKTMVDAAHARDIRILMDFVSNHVHEDHPYYREHPEWFGTYELPNGRQNLRLFDEYRLTTWFESYLPSFDYPGAPAAVDTMVSDALWWLKTLELDGFRHDAVKHVPHIFWRSLTRGIRRDLPGKDIYQIGETFGDHSLINSYVNNGQLSAQFNFNLYWPARYAFATANAPFAPLADELERVVDIYGQLHLMANLMDSHDQPRYAAYLEHDLDWGEDAEEAGWERHITVDDPVTYDKIAMYMTYLMSIPGPPAIYYGDEIGMTGAADPDNRRVMRWETSPRQRELRAEIAALTALRRSHSALRYGDYYTLKADRRVYAWLRSDFNERLLTVVHRADAPASIVLEFPPRLEVKELRCLHGNPGIRRDPLNSDVYHLEADAYSGYVFEVVSK
jgi:glycosidase